MNRSRYVQHPGYSYQPQQYGSFQPQTQTPGMMPPQQPLSMPATTYANPLPGMGQSPIQNSLSPSAMWTANFANGPIIEDLCAPPPPMGMHTASPPMNAYPPRMPMGPMHPGVMAQVHNVYGVQQPTPVPFAQGMHPAQSPSMQGLPSSRVMGTYPPYTGQQHGIGMAYPPRPFPPNGGLGRPGLDTGFTNPVPTVPGGNGLRMGQITSPNVGAGPAADGVPPLTPVEEALRGFLSPDLGDLGQP